MAVLSIFLNSITVVIFLNYVYFAIITLLGLMFLFSKGWAVRSPFDRQQKLRFSGPEMLWVLTFGTGLLAFSAPGAIDLMAIRLLVLEILCVVAIVMAKHRVVWSFPILIYLIYLCWIIFGITYTASAAYGIRVLLKYLYPLILTMFASAVVRHKEVFIKASLLARTVAVVCVIVSFLPYAGRVLPVFWYVTARAINFISIMILSLGLYFYTDEKRKNLIWAVVFIIPCFVWVFRTSIMGSAVALMAFSFIKYRLRSLPIIFGIIVASVVAVFTIPSLREKMFYKEDITLEDFREGELSADDVDSNARFALWESLQNRFYVGHEVVGSGTGSVQQYMYTHREEFGGLMVPHSDFIQLMCDNGLVGLVLYVLILLTCFAHCFFTFQVSQDPAIKLCAIVAGSLMIGIGVTLYSDNVVNYSMATLSMPFGFYGMMLGLVRAEKNKDS